MQHNKKALLLSIVFLVLHCSFDINASKVAVLKTSSRLESFDTNLEHLSNVMVSGAKIVAIAAIPFAGYKLYEWMQQGRVTKDNTEKIIQTQVGHGATLNQHSQQLASIQNVQIAHGADLSSIKKFQEEHGKTLQEVRVNQQKHTVTLAQLQENVVKVLSNQASMEQALADLKQRVNQVFTHAERADGNSYKAVAEIAALREVYNRASAMNLEMHQKTQQELERIKVLHETMRRDLLEAITRTERTIHASVQGAQSAMHESVKLNGFSLLNPNLKRFGSFLSRFGSPLRLVGKR